MRYSLTCALLGIFAVQSLALPTSSLVSRVTHERRDVSQQRRWTRGSPLEPEHVLPVRIGLKQSNLDKAMDYLLEVSDPRSSKYGKHYTAEQVSSIFEPANDTVEAVKAWLIAAGIPEGTISQSSNKGWIQFDASVQDIEQLLEAKYYYYEHPGSDRQHIGCDEYTVPAMVADHIDFVTPGVKFAATQSMSSLKKRGIKSPSRRPVHKKAPADVLARVLAAPDATDDCDSMITPACIKAIYNISDPVLHDSSNTLGLYEFGDIYAQQDLNLFFENFAPNIPSGTGPIAAFVDGATAPTSQRNAGLESSLDFDIAYPLIYPQTITLYQTDASQFEGDRIGLFNNFLDAVDGSYCTFSSNGETGDDPTIDPVYSSGSKQCGVYKPANVISFSYGLVEADYPTNYQQRQCNEFMKLGLQGVTIVFASGDDGVADRNGPCLGPQETIFSPDYPDCPYVTMVGATVLPSGSSVGDPETAVTSFASGGGFSNIYAQPSYQLDAVNAFFANHNPPYKSYSSLNGTLGAGGGIYNRIGRGSPDISALGDNAVIVAEGFEFLEGGTSMSAPLVASIFTRINEERLAVGKGPIGFVNPTLYAHPEVFNDITVGNQALGGCGTNGFSAVSGWDPVTGLGTPRYPELLEVFLALD
ncbi:peptidase S8/S53 domain-containing protein [Xylogone sp. PMI_703]|nr:peptidase S8/S53 domain-containing protein [Xylogone sp. PMI_703]